MRRWRWPWLVYLACFLCLATGLTFGIGITELRHAKDNPASIRYEGRLYECYPD